MGSGVTGGVVIDSGKYFFCGRKDNKGFSGWLLRDFGLGYVGV